MRAARSLVTVVLLAGALGGCSSPDAGTGSAATVNPGPPFLGARATQNRHHRAAAVQRLAGAGA